jgi:hypothetical protein
VKKLIFFLLLLFGFSELPARDGVSAQSSIASSVQHQQEKTPLETFSGLSKESLFAINNIARVSVSLPNLSNHVALILYSQFFRLKIQAELAGQKLKEEHKSEKQYLFNNYPSHNFW